MPDWSHQVFEVYRVCRFSSLRASSKLEGARNVKIRRLIDHSRISAARLAKTLRSLEMRATYIDTSRSDVIDLLCRYMVYRGQYLERVEAARQIKAHWKKLPLSQTRWQLSQSEFFRAMESNDVRRADLVDRIEQQASLSFPDLRSTLDIQQDLDVFLMGLTRYVDLIACRNAWQEMFGDDQELSQLLDWFSDYRSLPEGRYADAAQYFSRKLLFAERLYPWRWSFNEEPISKRYSLLMLQSGIQEAETKGMRMLFDIEQLELDLDQTEAARLRRFFERLHSRLSDFGWEEALSETLGDSWESGEGAFFDAPGINVIPGATKMGCMPVVVAMASGLGRKRTHLGPVCKKLSEHLAECAEISKAVIFLTDTVDPKTIEDRLKLFEIYQAKGIQFRMIVVRGNRMTPVPFFE